MKILIHSSAVSLEFLFNNFLKILFPIDFIRSEYFIVSDETIISTTLPNKLESGLVVFPTTTFLATNPVINPIEILAKSFLISDEETIKHIQSAHAVFFSGGDQLKLISLFKGSKLLQAIKKKYFSDQHFILGGTSAGAMVLPEIIISGGIIGSVLFKGDIHICDGFNLIQNIIVDTHFIKRGRIARLAHAVAINPTCLGIGLEENTALLISNGNHAECIGSGMIIILDGNKIRKSNIQDVKKETPITMENLSFTILAEGSCYSLIKRRGIEK